ncbi:ABC transporter ATP-binding protein [Xanthobacter tagetidis]|jgi:branched-chain amino acid transport system ATP-binding protein|uniref:ABC transporter ATP-binding protein n=1 Tax=Xanthobacter tagetidis TaxID=60216 RepID=A0A3L7AJJ1_9HYPH|nr:ABC transporter ATP-binding protein [Xanthobacter tagetidis]MBB6309105.1 branched-chain amino acid transport system ATP-binding protein [Xanthobacter tagetidis]RLP80407.1 ABC transporter ATP-binding protein [Xanthobacter tagetidis]
MLRIENLTGGYGRIIAVRDVSLTVGAGELVAVIGRNGAGKSTLLKTISGVQPSYGGSVRLGGQELTRLDPAARVRAGLAHVPEGRQLFGALSVEDNLRLGAHHRSVAEADADIEQQFDMFPVLRERRRSQAGALSGGQQQMLALGRALMAAPRVLMLDEPSMGLAPQLVAQILRIIRTLKERGTTILLVEQNARAALAIADRAYVLETGRVALEGPASDVLQNPRIKDLYLGY